MVTLSEGGGGTFVLLKNSVYLNNMICVYVIHTYDKEKRNDVTCVFIVQKKFTEFLLYARPCTSTANMSVNNNPKGKTNKESKCIFIS